MEEVMICFSEVYHIIFCNPCIGIIHQLSLAKIGNFSEKKVWAFHLLEGELIISNWLVGSAWTRRALTFQNFVTMYANILN